MVLFFLGSDDIFQGLGEKSLDDDFLGQDLDGGAETPQDTIYGVYGGLTRKGLNAMSAMEREDYLRALEFASPAFIEAVLKGYQMAKTGVTTLRGKIITDEAGKPIRLETGEGIAQAAGFRPERLATVKISGFGNFVTREKRPRKGRNPQSGEKIMISGRRVLTFKPSVMLRKAVNQGG